MTVTYTSYVGIEDLDVSGLGLGVDLTCYRDKIQHFLEDLLALFKHKIVT